MITLKNITRIYNQNIDETKALDQVSLTINEGELIAIMGPSGSGKSTLLNIIGCMDRATSGEIYYNQNNISEFKSREIQKFRKEKIGFIFQHFALMDYYTAYENVELPLLAKNVRRKKRKEMIMKQMKELDILDVVNKIPSKMSGGQQQRVAIARALVSGCEIILADEPTGALDQKNGQEVLSILKKINDEGKTVIIVTHDEKVAQKTDRIIYICDGKVKYDGKTSEVIDAIFTK